jgi:hypothetical protein
VRHDLVTTDARGRVPRVPEHPVNRSAGADGADLVNLWRVSGAAEESTAAWLRLDQTEFHLWRDCGVISGDWRASADLFLASVVGADGTCFPVGTLPAVPWLESATGRRATADGWVLTDADGTTLATLTIDGAPAAHTDAAPSFTDPTPLSAPADGDESAASRLPAPRVPAPGLPDPLPTTPAWALPVSPALPAGTVPATAADLAGRWVPAGLTVPTDPHVLFRPDGSWRGSDGCNGNRGRWTVNGRGGFLATSGMSTMMFCEGAPVPAWLAAARRAGIDAGRLRLFAGDGDELGVLEPG